MEAHYYFYLFYAQFVLIINLLFEILLLFHLYHAKFIIAVNFYRVSSLYGLSKRSLANNE